MTTIELSNLFVDAVRDNNRVSGYTHNYYSYPARFSPQFANIAIQEFSNQGDLVFDPFLGGGTTSIEAMVNGRSSIGLDVNSLATFIAQVKTSILSAAEMDQILQWVETERKDLKMNRLVSKNNWWKQNGYWRNMPWRIRKFLEIVIDDITLLDAIRSKNFVRCALLKTGQWALNKKNVFPTTSELRGYFFSTINDHLRLMEEFVSALPSSVNSPMIFNLSASKFDRDWWMEKVGKKAKLVLTSPPYPNVHVLYHRWQIQGRKETPALYWVANQLDGNNASHYTMGNRSKSGEQEYFKNMLAAFANIHDVLADDGLVVQMIGFSEVDMQLPIYLDMMEAAGFQRLKIQNSGVTFPQLARDVPSRKWYTQIQEETNDSLEYLLIHSKGGQHHDIQI